MMVIIYFIGLIAHFTLSSPDNSFKMEVAALVVSKDDDQTPNHRPELIVSKSAVLQSVNPFPAAAPRRDDKSDLVYYDLTGAGVVHVSGLSATSMLNPMPNFIDDVKSLIEVTGQEDLVPDVRYETSSTVWAFIELEGGQLSVAGYFKDAGQHNPTMSQPKCVPSRVQYTGSAPEGVIEFISSNGHHLRINVKAAQPPSIYIANLPAPGHEHMSGHFKEYAKLMNSKSAGTWKPTVTCSSIDNTKPIFDPGSIGRNRGDSIDCTNTHFP